MCPAKFDDGLAVNGIANLKDPGITPPKVKRSVQAEFSNEARRKHGHFSGEYGVVVGSDGKAQDLCITQSVGYGLDAKAAKAISQYQFSAAKKDGKPVPVRLTIEVDFTLY